MKTQGSKTIILENERYMILEKKERLFITRVLLLSFSSVQLLSCVRLFATPWTTALQASLPINNSWSLLKLMSSSWWCHPTISSSVFPFSSHLQSFPASWSFQMNQLLTSSGQSIGVSVSIFLSEGKSLIVQKNKSSLNKRTLPWQTLCFWEWRANSEYLFRFWSLVRLGLLVEGFS